MQCKEFQQQFHSGDRMGAENSAHLASCDLCRQWRGDQLLRERLRSYQPATLDAATTERLLGRARTAAKPPVMPWLKQGVAAVALLVLGVFLGQQWPASDRQWQQVPVLSVTERGMLHQVNLVIDSPDEMAQATIRIVLADNLALDGYPGTRELSWSSSLMEGSNLLQLPLLLPEGQASFLEVTYGDGTVWHSQRVEFSAFLDDEQGAGA